jgi:S-adenosylmethionine:tRNA ribosyltransferase-isomerase
VDGVLSGTHELASSHAALLGAFAGPALLARAVAQAEACAFTTHELGEAMLVLPGARPLLFGQAPRSTGISGSRPLASAGFTNLEKPP